MTVAVAPAARHGNARVLIACSPDRRPEPGAHGSVHQGQHVMGGVPWRHTQVTVGGSYRIKALALSVDQHRRRSVAFQEEPSAKLGERGLVRRCSALPRMDGEFTAVSGAHRKAKAKAARPPATDMPVKAFRLGDDFETAPVLAGCFRAAEEEGPALVQGEVKQRYDLGLRLGTEIDEEVPARHEVEPRERRVGQHVLHREHHGGAQLGSYPIPVIFLGKEACEAGRRDIRRDRFRIEPLAGENDGVGIHVGGEDLQLDAALRGRDRFVEQHGQGIGFLAGAASGDPHPDRVIVGMLPDEIGNDRCRKALEHASVAEKARDVDEKVLGQVVEFSRVAAQRFQVSPHVAALDREQPYPPLDPAPQRPLLVEREIVGRSGSEELDDSGEAIRQPTLRRDGVSAIAGDLLVVFQESGGNFVDRQHEIDRTCRDRAARHAVVAGFLGVLCDDEPAFGADRTQAEAAVGPRPRQHHTTRPRAVVLGQRAQQEIERQPRTASGLGLRKVQDVLTDGQVCSGRDDVEVLAFDRHPVLRLPHGQGRRSGEQIHHQTFVGGIEMLDEDEGHAGAGGKRSDQARARFEPARRGADADDHEIVTPARRPLGRCRILASG